MPKRIQRKRTKGWRMPPNTVYVGRPTEFGNPLALGEWCNWNSKDYDGNTHEDCVNFYREWIMEQYSPEELRERLGGKDLACWCPLNQPCHADILLELANE